MVKFKFLTGDRVTPAKAGCRDTSAIEG